MSNDFQKPKRPSFGKIAEQLARDAANYGKGKPPQAPTLSKRAQEVAKSAASGISPRKTRELEKSVTGRKVVGTTPMSWKSLPDDQLGVPGSLDAPSLEREMYNYDLKNFGAPTLGYLERVPKGMEAKWKERMAYRGKMQAVLAKRLGQQKGMDRQASAPYMPEDLEEATLGMSDPVLPRALADTNLALQAWRHLSGGKADNPLAMTEYALKTAPTIGTDSDVDLALRAASIPVNDPLGYGRAALGDARTINELPGWAQVTEAIGNIIPQIAGSSAVGVSGSARGIAKLGQIIANSALFDLPAYATMAKDTGGVDKAAQMMAQMIGRTFAADATPAERTQGGIILAGLGLGAYGKMAGRKPAPRPRPGDGVGPAPKPVTGMRERTRYAETLLGDLAPEAEKANFKPKAARGYPKGEAIDIRARLKPKAEAVAPDPQPNAKDPWGYYKEKVNEYASSRGPSALDGNTPTGRIASQDAFKDVQSMFPDIKNFGDLHRFKPASTVKTEVTQPRTAKQIAPELGPIPQPKPRPSQGTGTRKPTTEAPRLVANRVAPETKVDTVHADPAKATTIERAGVSEDVQSDIRANYREVFYQNDKRSPEQRKSDTDARLARLKDAKRRARDMATPQEVIEAGKVKYGKRTPIQSALTEETIVFTDEIKSAAKLGRGDRIGVNTVEGSQWWTNTHFAFKGELPKGITQTEGFAPSIERVIPTKDGVPLERRGSAITSSDYGNKPLISTVFADERGRVYTLDAGYVAGAERYFGKDIEFHGVEPSRPVTVHKNGEIVGVIMPTGAYDGIQLPVAKPSPRTAKQIASELGQAAKDLVEADLKDFEEGRTNLGGGMRLSDRQKAALTRIAKLSIELGHKTVEDAVKWARETLGDAWTEAQEKVLRANWKRYVDEERKSITGPVPPVQRATREAVEAPTKKDTVPPVKEEIAPPTTQDSPAGATGMARQFEDVERTDAGKAPTKGQGLDRNALAEEGERSYKADPMRVARIVDEAHKANRVLTEVEVAQITAYKRDLVNKMNRIESAAMGKDSAEHYHYAQMDVELDKISDLAQTTRNKFHTLGMALQTAFHADFSVAELARRARVFMGEELSGEFKAKFEGLQTKYAQALKDLDTARAKIESLLKTGTGTKGAGRNLKVSAARRLQDMGFAYAGEPIPKSGGLGSKKRGSARLPGMDENAAKAINDYVRGLIYEDGYHGLDDLIIRVQQSFPQLTEGHVLSALSGEYAKAKRRMDVGRAEAIKTFNEVKRVAEYRRLSRMRKIGSNLSEIFRATSRAFQTFFDVSAPFIQGLPTLATHPKLWIKAWKPMLEAAAKGGGFVDEHYTGITDDARYPDAKAAGLEVSLPGGSFSAQEEMFAGAIAKRMATSKTPGIRQVGQLVERSEAAFTVFLNEIRWSVYKKLVALDPGNPDYRKDVARIINIATGKGHGKLANSLKSSPFAGDMLYAPRYSLSQFQLAGEPLAILAGGYKTSKGRKAAAIEYAKIAGTIALTGAVVEMMGGEVERDPRSTDFGRWRLPNGVTVNLFGRVSDPIKLISQIFWGRISQSGEYTDAGDYGAADFWSVLKSKASPVLRTAHMTATGKTYDSRTGDRNIALWELATENFTPIGGREIVKTLADESATSAEKQMSATQFFGVDSKATKDKTGKKAPPPMGLPTGLKRMLGMEQPKQKSKTSSRPSRPSPPKMPERPKMPSAPF